MPQPLPKIRNFQIVTPWLYRGGQPTTDGLDQLASLGVKTIISLRSGKVAARYEQAAAGNRGMQLVHMPFTYFNMPDETAIKHFLSLLDDQANAPIFIHCLHGADRTGFMIAIFRMERLGWDVADAYREMKSCGFHRFRLPHFKWVLWNYARSIGQEIKQDILAVNRVKQ